MTSAALPRHRVRPARVPETAPSPTARYRYDAVSGDWWWSPGMHALLGLDPLREPGIEALLTTQHPDDGARLLAALTATFEGGRPFAVETRVLHPTSAQRSVVVTGEPLRDETGALRGVEGHCADITGSRAPDPDAATARALQVEVAQMRTAMASRAVIEQAKGVLMLLTNCGEQTAFDLLAHLSSNTHRKVRDVAHLLTESAAGRTRLPEDVGAILRDACPPAQPLR
ncbi:PAS and ANTAR domain-containing protein [Blastococcus sp. TF02A-35]|uniref:PAS and ANTAR domain-containing protein n=1 Tax=Blastococcus sp. TF02A-35 TaxID=2559612 RepID=UPI0010741626|nr:PAS and ANTAR domain-containing protein [Blastococcus sp. TF02A_35]TFV48532.1 ANTAR domain-containing protein [Blastococcus sp. TF02A_35]